MVCTHLKQLYDLCETHQLKMAGSDLIRIVCKTCNEHEVCPSMLMDEYDARYKTETEINPVVEMQIHPTAEKHERRNESVVLNLTRLSVPHVSTLLASCSEVRNTVEKFSGITIQTRSRRQCCKFFRETRTDVFLNEQA